jgi:hypothetical protein
MFTRRISKRRGAVCTQSRPHTVPTAYASGRCANPHADDAHVPPPASYGRVSGGYPGLCRKQPRRARAKEAVQRSTPSDDCDTKQVGPGFSPPPLENRDIMECSQLLDTLFSPDGREPGSHASHDAPKSTMCCFDCSQVERAKSGRFHPRFPGASGTPDPDSVQV